MLLLLKEMRDQFMTRSGSFSRLFLSGQMTWVFLFLIPGLILVDCCNFQAL